MKGLTKELRQSSISKWCWIEDKLIKKIKCDYKAMYWRPCGFCVAVEKNCNKCSLNRRIENILVCEYEGNKKSHAYSTLVLAKYENYDEALIHCRIVLKKIRSTRIDKEVK